VIAFIALALAAAPHPESYTQIQARVASEVAGSEKEMDLQFQLALKRLRNCKANTLTCYYWNKAVPRLQREQAAWKQWRDAKSDLDAVEMEGTSGEAEVRAYSKIKMTKARTSELSKIGRQ
jgi:uncharacterized protein YecT (DUF1311 family)